MLLDWPVENGEAIQILRYGVGAQYKPHYDYFDPAWSGTAGPLKCGGQRVASLVMYLNTPERGGATTFPVMSFEVAAVKGNAVFLRYGSQHKKTHTVNGAATELAGVNGSGSKMRHESHHRQGKQ